MFLYAGGMNDVFRFLVVLLLFIFILFITYFTTRFIANYQKGKINGGNIEIVETARISQNKYIQIVRIGEEYFALAVCKDTVTNISKIPKEELNFEVSTQELPGFKDIFDKAKNKIKKKDDNQDNA